MFLWCKKFGCIFQGFLPPKLVFLGEGPFSKIEGLAPQFYALKCFSNVILRDKLAVKHKDKLKTITELFFYKRPLALITLYLYLYYYDSALYWCHSLV